MKRFKVGDHVRSTAGSQGKYTQPGELLEAVVTGLNPDGDIRIRVIRHTKFDANPMAVGKAARKKTRTKKGGPYGFSVASGPPDVKEWK